jgi:arginine/lysine/ornithine decarboxylase
LRTARSFLRSSRIGALCDYILFDEAWAGFMKFHPIYAGRFAESHYLSFWLKLV